MSNDKLAEALRKELGELLDREWQKILRPVLLKRIGLYLDEVKAHAAEAAQPLPQMTDAEHAEIQAKYGTAQAAEPFVYAYVYPDGTRFDTGGREINGSRPTKTIPLYPHPQPAQDAKLPSAEDFRLHLGELTPAELRVAQAAFRYAMAKESGR